MSGNQGFVFPVLPVQMTGVTGKANQFRGVIFRPVSPELWPLLLWTELSEGFRLVLMASGL